MSSQVTSAQAVYTQQNHSVNKLLFVCPQKTWNVSLQLLEHLPWETAYNAQYVQWSPSLARLELFQAEVPCSWRSCRGIYRAVILVTGTISKPLRSARSQTCSTRVTGKLTTAGFGKSRPAYYLFAANEIAALANKNTKEWITKPRCRTIICIC